MAKSKIPIGTKRRTYRKINGKKRLVEVTKTRTGEKVRISDSEYNKRRDAINNIHTEKVWKLREKYGREWDDDDDDFVFKGNEDKYNAEIEKNQKITMSKFNALEKLR